MNLVPPDLLDYLYLRAEGAERYLVAIAGPPASGKSTLADNLVLALNKRCGSELAVVLPMDGYHLDNVLLDEMGARARKGAPHTFDVDGFASMLQRVAVAAQEVVVPVFDRTLDLARAGGRRIVSSHRIIVVEGNYLLLDQPGWSSLRDCFDYTVFLHVDEAELRRRLIQRWLDYGLTQHDAEVRAEQNDLPNARLVLQHSHDADSTRQHRQQTEK